MIRSLASILLVIGLIFAFETECLAKKKKSSIFDKKSKKKSKDKKSALKTIVLGGQQSRGIVKINISKNPILVKKNYIVPKGKTLHIYGAGALKYAITGNSIVKASPGHPIYGGGHSGGLRNHYASIRINGKLILGEKKPLEDTDHSQLPSISIHRVGFGRGAWLEVYNLAFKGNNWGGGTANCHVKMYNCRLLGYHGAVTLNPNYSSIIYHTILDASLRFTENHPRKITKNVKIVNCVLYDDKRASMSALWSMDKCDIYGRPFIIKNYKWTSVAKIEGTNYFHDDEFPLYLDHAFQEDINKGIRVKTASQPFNQFEGLQLPQ